MNRSATAGSTPMSLADVVRTSIVVVVALVVQSTIVDAVQFRGAHADLMILLTVAAGYVTGPDRGAAVGFAVGLVADLFLPTTFGLSALVGCLLGYSAGLASAGLVRSPWWPAPLVLGAGAAAGTFGYAVLATVLGAPHLMHTYLVPALVMTAAGGVVLAPAVVAAVRWAVPVPGSSQASAVGAGGSAVASRRPTPTSR
ncbi:MAG: rod shape-determining protein MreD [Actinomycetota bacterium]|nr:rod shape-determining protein MreD [Actinomycetota bacterium]MDA8279337.1 rod shape-determining protein MreD [Actinomycetota bacterium]MDA8342553.1 rod shape-determining protein MreD [Actinomycetota bacterium]